MDTYHLRISGQVDVEDLNTICPHQGTLLQSEPGETLLSIYTDQSGMIGMLRQLHSLGLHVLSVDCCPERKEK